MPSTEEIRVEKARRNLAEFVRQAWHIVEPGTQLLWNWHIDAVSEHLQAVTEGHIRRLVINIPPGHCKSLITSVFWPAWEWIDAPDTRSIFTSYALDLARRDSVRCRDLITSDWYQQAFDVHWTVRDGHWRLKGDQNAKDYYQNSKSGFRFCTSVGSRATGFRGKKVVSDDPLNAKEMHSKLVRDECIFWWDKVMPTRINDPRTGAFVIIMQRLHEEDLTGHVLEMGGYEHLCLPSEYDPKRKSITFALNSSEFKVQSSELVGPVGPVGQDRNPEAARNALGSYSEADAENSEPETRNPELVIPVGKRVFWQDPREVEGELLHSELFTPEVLAGLKTQLGSADYAGQHLQKPSPDAGMIFKRHWWRYWCYPGQRLQPVTVKDTEGNVLEIEAVPLPDTLDEILQSWDFAFKDKKTSDFVAGQVWGRKGANRFMLDYVKDRLDLPASLNAVRKMSNDWPKARAKLVEDKANGPAVIQTLTGEIPGLIAVDPEGGKEARAHAVSPYVEAGNVFVPHPSLFSWVDPFLTTASAFPNVAKDDDVDACTQALIRFKRPPDKPLHHPVMDVGIGWRK